jgi:FAD/FMN-containing dehydrogenase
MSAGLTRRRLVRNAAGAAGVLVAGRIVGVDAFGRPRLPQPSERAWRMLERELAGRVVRPGDRDFAHLRLPWNRRYREPPPLGIARCATERDVSRALLWARDHDLPLVARSSGHSYAGYSTTPGLLIDVGGMRDVTVDDATGSVTAGPGVRNTMVYAALQPHDVAISAGRCPTVAIAGLTLGGGFGFSSRLMGLTCDALEETRVVTADGEIRTCSATENPDLVWALRGGGGGNFAINTTFRFRTSPVSDVGLYDITWDGRHAPAVMAALQAMVQSAPDRLSCRMGMGSDGRSAPTVSALGQLFGSVEELRTLLAPVLAVAKPAKQLIAQRTFWQAKEHFFHNTPVDRFAVKSAFVTEPFSETALDVIARGVARYPGSHNPDGGGVALYAWGGAIGRVPVDATAFVHRDAVWLMAYDASWTRRDTRRTIRRNLDWLARFDDDVRPFLSSQAYQNFTDRTLRDWRTAYYGDAYPRLQAIKRAVDPDGVFRFPQAV